MFQILQSCNIADIRECSDDIPSVTEFGMRFGILPMESPHIARRLPGLAESGRTFKALPCEAKRSAASGLSRIVSGPKTTTF